MQNVMKNLMGFRVAVLSMALAALSSLGAFADTAANDYTGAISSLSTGMQSAAATNFGAILLLALVVIVPVWVFKFIRRVAH